MIVETYPSKRKPILKEILPTLVKPAATPPVVMTGRPNEQDKTRARQFMIEPEEFVRRDNIVRELFLNCNFRPGEVTRPLSETSFKIYGYLTIRGIFKSYHDFPTAEATAWPKDDKPWTITCEPTNKEEGELLVVTSEFLKPSSPLGATC